MTLPPQRDFARIDYGGRLRAGVLVPSGNVIAEAEIRAMLPPGVTALVTRLALRGSSEAELIGMIAGLEDAVRLLADAEVGVIVFHCTAVSTFAPRLAAEICRRIEHAAGIPAFATSDAILAAIAALKISKLSLLTPYVEAVHAREIAFLAAHGIAVVGGAHLGIDTNVEMATLPPSTLAEWVLAHPCQEADGYFLSCTAIRSAVVIAHLEESLGRPVLTSNQAMVWHLLRHSRIGIQVEGFGRLLSQSTDGAAAAPVTGRR
jgi:maleate isomerase